MMTIVPELTLDDPGVWPRSVPPGGPYGQRPGGLGAPKRLLTDRAPTFGTIEFQACLGGYGVRHVRTKPAHPWTNGRIERVFRTFQETVASVTWLVSSVAQLDRFVADFRQWHNRDRPHSAWNGRTPNEVFFGRPKRLRTIDRVTYFDGRLAWYQFG